MSTWPGLDYATQNPEKLGDNALDLAISDLNATRDATGHAGKLVEFRIERLTRTFKRAIAVQQESDPILANVSVVTLS